MSVLSCCSCNKHFGITIILVLKCSYSETTGGSFYFNIYVMFIKLISLCFFTPAAELLHS